MIEPRFLSIGGVTVVLTTRLVQLNTSEEIYIETHFYLSLFMYFRKLRLGRESDKYTKKFFTVRRQAFVIVTPLLAKQI